MTLCLTVSAGIKHKREEGDYLGGEGNNKRTGLQEIIAPLYHTVVATKSLFRLKKALLLTRSWREK